LVFITIYTINYLIQDSIHSGSSHPKCQAYISIQNSKYSLTTNLSLRDRSDPRNSNISRDGNSTQNPKDLSIMNTIIPKNNRKDDPTKISTCANYPAYNSIGKWVHVRNEGEVGTIASIHEDSKTGNESEHGGFGMRVCEADGDFENSHHDAAEDEPAFLAPDGMSLLVDDIGDETTEGSKAEVHEAEHGGPAAGTGLA